MIWNLIMGLLIGISATIGCYSMNHITKQEIESKQQKIEELQEKIDNIHKSKEEEINTLKINIISATMNCPSSKAEQILKNLKDYALDYSFFRSTTNKERKEIIKSIPQEVDNG